MRHTVTPLDSIAVLEKLTALGSHTFWPLDQSVIHLPEQVRSRVQGYRQITDAVLLAAAMQRGGQLATLGQRPGGAGGGGRPVFCVRYSGVTAALADHGRPKRFKPRLLV